MSSRVERESVVAELENEFRNATGIYLADNNKINVEKITKLRADLRNNGIRVIVVKNTLAKKACERVGKETLSPFFKGPTVVAITKNEGTAPAKIIKEFQKDNKDLFTFKVSYVDGSIFTAEDTAKLADIPSREVLLSQLLGCLQAPMQNFAGALNGILSKLVGTLEAVKEQKSSAQ
ncbi:MAG: 50S ribosomal protein L10 [Fibrobacter sp.]|nr:50S ribosomal protein L10 [Fibrobacter sp.]